MKRGDIVVAREPGTVAAKARPCLIVQRTSTLALTPRITVCPLTSVQTGFDQVRIPLGPDAGNGLDRPSEIQINRIETVDVDCIAGVSGSVPPSIMARVDIALKRWLDL